MGTIMVKDETKTILIKIEAALERQKGERIDYDAAISFLIYQYLEKQKNWEKFKIFCRPIFNLTMEEILKEIKKGRLEDEKKYDRY
jgi:hypothetical protein